MRRKKPQLCSCQWLRRLSLLLALDWATMVVPLPASAQLNQTCTASALNRTAPVDAEGVWVLPNVPATIGEVQCAPPASTVASPAPGSPTSFPSPPTASSKSRAEIIGPNAYLVVLGTPGNLAQDVRDEFNLRIRDDDRVVPVGTAMLPPNAMVVGPGQVVNTIGAILTTQPCSMAPNPGSDDIQIANTIVAGPNGVAETVADNAITNVGLPLNSAWRNPERNEAFSGQLQSRHQYGGAVDLDRRAPAEGLNLMQLFCILETAGDAVATGIPEENSTQRVCNDPLVTHIHIQQ